MAKRILSMVMAIILCFGLIVPTTVAADSTLPYFEKIITVDGDEITLKITLRGPDKACAGGQVDIYYPEEKMEYVCPEVDEYDTELYSEDLGWLAIGNGSINGHTDPGRFCANFFSISGVSTDSVLCEVKFTLTNGTVTAGDFTYEELIADNEPKEVENPTDIIFNCLHTNETVTTVDATCDKAGSETTTCDSCGETSTVAIPATGNHTESGWIVDKEATETEDGSKHTECTVCGTTIKTEVIPATGSEFDENLPYWDKDIVVDGDTVKLTITLRGPNKSCAGGQVDIFYPTDKLEYVCPGVDENNLELYDENLPWLCIGYGSINGHTQPGRFCANFFSMRGVATDQLLCDVEFKIINDSTITADDFTYTQILADAVGTEVFNSTPINFSCLHTNATVTKVDATCNTDGSETAICDNCGEETVTVIPATGNHTESDWIVDKEATATTDGSKHTECTVCGTTIKTEVIPATGSEFDENLPYWDKDIVVDGDTVKLTITLRGPNKSCAGGQVDIFYPTDKLEYVCPGVDENNLELYDENLPWLCIGYGSINGHTQPGRFCANFFSMRGVATDQLLCDVEFKIKNNSTITAADFTYTQILADAVGVEVFNSTPINFSCLHTNKTNVSKVDATCTEAGSSTDKCSSCGEEVTTEIPALGHDTTTETVDATCTAEGTVTTSCSRCDYTDVATIPALGHDLSTVTVDATCGKDGSTTTSCSRCDYEDVQTIPATGNHTESGWIVDKEATATEDGSKHTECTVCGEVIKTEVIPATGSEFDENLPYWDKDIVVDGDTVKLTITLRGPNKSCAGGQVDIFYPTDKLEYVCPGVDENNLELYDENLPWLCIGYGSINGHTQPGRFCANFFSMRGVATDQLLCDVEFKIKNNSTITAADFTYTQILADAVGVEVFNSTPINFSCLHTNKTNVSTVPATCTEAGSSTDKCSSCGEEVTTEIPALGHDLSTVTVEPTCTVDGTATTTCSRCDYEDVATTPALGHSYTSVVTAPTCTEAGFTTYTCSACDDSYVADEVAALGHTPGEWETVKEPTYTEAGSAEKKCTVCGETVETKVLDKLAGLYGDFNGDGMVAIDDAALIARYVNRIIPLPEERKEFIDVNGDGIVNTGDAVLIARKCAYVIDKFPVEQ